jgi:hypothetical protein
LCESDINGLGRENLSWDGAIADKALIAGAHIVAEAVGVGRTGTGLVDGHTLD